MNTYKILLSILLLTGYAATQTCGEAWLLEIYGKTPQQKVGYLEEEKENYFPSQHGTSNTINFTRKTSEKKLKEFVLHEVNKNKKDLKNTEKIEENKN